MFNQTFNRVIWLDVLAIGAIITALKTEMMLSLMRRTPDAKVWVAAAIVGFGLSLTATLIIPIWRAWWSIKHPKELATWTYAFQGLAALVTGLSVIIAGWGFVKATLFYDSSY